MAPRRPNVLIFCVDEMRADHMGCAGNSIVRTPQIDALAARGVRFERAYCNNPICMPARASMFTGLLPRDHGVRVNGQALRRDLPTLPGMLGQAGYRTHAAGKLHLSPWAPRVDPPEVDRYPECLDYWRDGRIREFPTPYYGFESVDFVGGHVSYAYGDYMTWLVDQGGDPALLSPEHALQPPCRAPSCYRLALPEELHYNRYIADSAIRVIEESKRDGAPPFFIWCSFPDPHAPVAPPAPYADLYDPGRIPLPARREGEVDRLPPVYAQVFEGAVRPNGVDNTGYTDDHWREIIALTYGMVSHIDAELGRVLCALDRTGQADRTLVVFIADHGDMMGDHGLAWKAFYTFGGCIRIPLIVAAPGERDSRATDALAAQVDLMPTILDYCGVAMPGSDWVDQQTPFQRGAVRPLRPLPGVSWRPVVEGRAHAVRSSVVIENDDPTTGHQVRALVTADHRLSVYPGTPDGELFDLAHDPNELANLWEDPAHTRLRAELTARLLSDYASHTPLYPVPPWNS